MKIYKLQGDLDNLASFKPANEDSDCYVLDGNPKENWEKFDVEFDKGSKRHHRKLKDYSSISEPVFSKRAVEALQEITTEGVQLLPIHCIENDEDYYIVNVTNIVDCIDYEQAEYDRYESSGRIMWFTKYSFVPEKVNDQKIFKLIDEPKRAPFVTDEFMNKIEEKNLTGFKLELVWDSDDN